MNEVTRQKIIVITGVNGFVGKHLVRELSENGASVVGIGREPSADDEISGLLDGYEVADLSKEWPELKNVSAIIHLAGLAAVGPSFEEPQKYINLNSAMLTHMAEFYLTQEDRPRIIVVSSGAVYSADQIMPLTENSLVDFNSPYTVSKVLVENQCAYYRKRGIECVVVRPFNHIGPGQLPGFLVPDVIQQLRESGGATVGNIATKRDYTDVRDVAKAYRLLATSPQLSHALYNVCSGGSVSGKDIIKKLKAAINKPSAVITIDQSKIRPTDAPDIYGDTTRLREDTGWNQSFTLEQTLEDCVNL